MILNEYQIIEKFFKKNKSFNNNYVEQGIGDDCALINVPSKQTLAISVDTLVEGTHFLSDINPSDLGYKALAVNLSDLASAGAKPTLATLALTVPKVKKKWLIDFSDSFFQLLDNYNMQLIGGDTTYGKFINITISVYGFLPNGISLKRSGATIGDNIFVTGNLGISSAGLDLLLNKIHVNNKSIYSYLVNSHLRPIPRVLQGQALVGLASSAIDLSDGLNSDIRHIMHNSQCGVHINLESLPVSMLYEYFDEIQVLNWALNGGEDYELCFTVPKNKCFELNKALNYLNVPYTCIGEIISQTEGLKLSKNNKPYIMKGKGFEHFISS